MKRNRNQLWLARHDDGRTVQVKGGDSREALQDALESFDEMDQNVVSVECLDRNYEEKFG